MRSKLLLADAMFDVALGLLLVASPLDLFRLLGLPVEEPPFSSRILGGVLVGMGLAMLVELYRTQTGSVVLSLRRTSIINFFGALALAALLISGRMYIPLPGSVVLWGLVLLLIILSATEWWSFQKKSKGSP